MALTENCKGRLYNWKFEQAAERLTPDATEDEAALVNALGTMFGDVGYFWGDMQLVVRAAVSTLIGEVED